MTADPKPDDQRRPLSGRKKSELRRMARAHSEEALLALIEITNKVKAADHARVNAANSVLEWGHGRRGGMSAGKRKRKGTKTVRYILEPPSDT